MLKIFDLESVGFDKNIHVGEIASCNNELYVLIRINSPVQKNSYPTIAVCAEVVGQKIGSLPPEKGEFYQSYTEKYQVAKSYQHIKKVGDFLGANGLVGVITGITKVEYQFTDLLVTYDLLQLQEWPQSKVNDAVQKYRLSKFRLIQ